MGLGKTVAEMKDNDYRDEAARALFNNEDYGCGGVSVKAYESRTYLYWCSRPVALWDGTNLFVCDGEWRSGDSTLRLVNAILRAAGVSRSVHAIGTDWYITGDNYSGVEPFPYHNYLEIDIT